jgi:hypothetical protein
MSLDTEIDTLLKMDLSDPLSVYLAALSLRKQLPTKQSIRAYAMSRFGDAKADRLTEEIMQKSQRIIDEARKPL